MYRRHPAGTFGWSEDLTPGPSPLTERGELVQAGGTPAIR
jgi:hypothetical protein